MSSGDIKITEIQFPNAEFLPEVVKMLNEGHTVTLRLRGSPCVRSWKTIATKHCYANLSIQGGRPRIGRNYAKTLCPSPHHQYRWESGDTTGRRQPVRRTLSVGKYRWRRHWFLSQRQGYARQDRWLEMAYLLMDMDAPLPYPPLPLAFLQENLVENSQTISRNIELLK